MPRSLITLLLLLALLPRFAAQGQLSDSEQSDGRAAAAVSGNVDYFHGSDPAGQKRVLDGGTGTGVGYSPLSERGGLAGSAPELARQQLILPPHPDIACRPHAEQLPYHSTAPPSGQNSIQSN